ncbi:MULTISPECIES: DUF5666 domain-containing protein [unclassified Marinobacter]|uniref:DUF5666 domain-containing protein n=1 Tax=unclassified Marinobacter TaxID=83889 RepID=UPI0012684D29|nr:MULTISPECIES: DUF5666 domain-containing protein [unclassified Marinobacter]QFS88125.1 hypothetical protein FIV08_14920 [Marinobacter sp. THAF197a]QFT51910.1 hypothetical protein FIU96_14830 [Marinobacter sp. THAF39]
MKRNGLTTAVRMVIAGALAGTLAACGGGGSGDGSAVNASSQGTSVGAVTGFGSVYVNGTRFQTSGSVSSDDGIEREDQLHKGMILKVKGSWDGRGAGRADDVSYDDTLRGPLTSMNWDDIEKTGQLQLLNQTVRLDRQTVFRGATPLELAGNPGAYNVRISGWRMENGDFRASYVGARSAGSRFDDFNDVEIEGLVANLDTSARTFEINGLQIDYNSATGDDDFDLDDLRNGLAVEVEGYLENGILIAREIEDEDDLFDDDDDVEISGEIYDFDASGRSFRINGVQVQYNRGTEFDDIRESSLQNGLFVKVEGDFRNGVLIAEEIEGRDGDVELDGRLEQIDLSNEVLIVSGIRVQLTPGTLIDDDDDDDRRSRVEDINGFRVGDYLEIEGRQRSENGGYLEAFTIEREDDDDDDDYELEARIDALSSTSVTFMNLEILLNGYSTDGARVGDEVEVEYRRTSGGQYVLTDDIDD